MLKLKPIILALWKPELKASLSYTVSSRPSGLQCEMLSQKKKQNKTIKMVNLDCQFDWIEICIDQESVSEHVCDSFVQRGEEERNLTK